MTPPEQDGSARILETFAQWQEAVTRCAFQIKGSKVSIIVLVFMAHLASSASP